jgi:hypothetical protein
MPLRPDEPAREDSVGDVSRHRRELRRHRRGNLARGERYKEPAALAT